MHFTLEYEQENDGRWLAEVPQLPGVLAYGISASDAMAKAEVLALRVMAEQLENREANPVEISLSCLLLYESMACFQSNETCVMSGIKYLLDTNVVISLLKAFSDATNLFGSG